MYHQSDPRSTLTAPARPAAGNPLSTFGKPQLIRLRETEPSLSTAAGSRIWYVRTASFLVAYYELVAGDTVQLLDGSADRLLVVPHADELLAVRPSAGSVLAVGEPTVHVISGACQVDSRTAVTMIEAASYADLHTVPSAVNDAAYADPMPGVGDPRVRRVPGLRRGVKTYPMSAYEPSPDRFGRMFVASNVMVNLLETEAGPRDVDKLSPHSHADFEQCSITTRGRYVHHWRTPWTADLPTWREDQHPHCDSPSIAIIPPQIEHTANSVSAGPNQMIDFFAPPRDDFIDKGWILNADDGDVRDLDAS